MNINSILIKIKYICFFIIISALAIFFSNQLVLLKIKNSDFAKNSHISYMQDSTLRSFFYDSIGRTPLAVNSHTKIPSLSAISWILSSPDQGYFTHQSSDDITEDKTGSQKYTVSVGYVRNQKDLTNIIDELNSKGLPAASTLINDFEHDQIHRIDMGLYLTKKEAKQALDILSNRTSYKGMIVTLH